MKPLLLVAAVVGLTTAGCAQNRILGGQGQASHVTRSQLAPRPNMIRTDCLACSACGDSGCSDGGCFGGDCAEGFCSEGSSCGDSCCDVASCSDADGCVVQRIADRVRNRGCDNCGGRGCGLCSRVANRFNPHAGGYPEQTTFNPSPPTGQTAYPYYTTRGPRDFLQANPPSIGPY